VNGETIAPASIAAEAQHHPAKTPRAAAELAARALVVRKLLLDEAARLDIEAAPVFLDDGRRESEEEARIRALLERSVPAPHAEPGEALAYYAANPARFSGPDLFEASHILFGMGGGVDAEAQARAAIADLRLRPQRFEALARELSQCESGRNGGRLGQLAPGDMEPAFEAALRSLTVGEIAAEPAKTRFGFHVVRLDARAAGKVLPFDYVRERIEVFLAERRWRRNCAGFVARLIESAHIEGLDMAPTQSQRMTDHGHVG
jgi:peptidyl-prolyl cis-trans isomerase C